MRPARGSRQGLGARLMQPPAVRRSPPSLRNAARFSSRRKPPRLDPDHEEIYKIEPSLPSAVVKTFACRRRRGRSGSGCVALDGKPSAAVETAAGQAGGAARGGDSRSCDERAGEVRASLEAEGPRRPWKNPQITSGWRRDCYKELACRPSNACGDSTSREVRGSGGQGRPHHPDRDVFSTPPVRRPARAASQTGPRQDLGSIPRSAAFENRRSDGTEDAPRSLDQLPALVDNGSGAERNRTDSYPGPLTPLRFGPLRATRHSHGVRESKRP